MYQSSQSPPAPAPAPARHPGSSGFAVTSLVTGIVGLVFSWVPILDLVLAVIAIVFGSLAWYLTDRGRASGKGMGIAGLVMGIVTVAIFGILLGIGVAVG